MLVEVAKPVALGLCILSLCAVFYTAFLVPARGLEQRALDAVVLLSFAAGICLASGMLFREATQKGVEPVTRTLPVQMFCWAVCVIVVLFIASWYLETYCVFYKDVRRY
jgi:formate/nitrite transporter FocA (FNT family)